MMPKSLSDLISGSWMSGTPIAVMYKSTILLLAVVIALTSYLFWEFPYSVIISVVACTIIEIAIIKLYFKKELRVPYTAIITGMIIGAVASSNASWIILVLASAVAVLSKSFIRFKGSNIFNPAVLGLLVALVAFGTGDDWWIAGQFSLYGILIAVTPLLIIATYDARRLYAGVSFAIASIIISLIISGVGALSAIGIWTAIISANYFLAFIMVSEPKTSPHKSDAQVIYGIGIALLVSIMALYKIPYSLLFPLLIGNIGYLLYRVIFKSR